MPTTLIAPDAVRRSIHILRGQRVLLDEDLAALYGVETKALNRAVKRNRERFPRDFMFRLTAAEAAALRCQIGTSKRRGGRRYLPYAFSEHGVAMLSSVLGSKRAIAVNISIVRTFVALRRALQADAGLAKRLTVVEANLARHAAEFGLHRAETVRALKMVFETLKALAVEEEAAPAGRPVGFDLE